MPKQSEIQRCIPAHHPPADQQSILDRPDVQCISRNGLVVRDKYPGIRQAWGPTHFDLNHRK